MPAPDARTDNYSITEDQLLVGSANGFLNNDSDPDGDPLRIILIDGGPFSSFGTPITLASGAKLTINADGSFQYDQNGSFTHLSAGQTVNDIFTYTISDGRGGTDTSAVCMTISGVGGVIQNQPLIITGAISDVVEEEHGLPGGNEDTTDSNGLDTDESGPNTVTNASAGSFVPLITGGIDGTLSFAFAPLGGNPAVQTVSNGPLTSGGKQVYFDTEGPNLIGYYNANGDNSDYDAADTKVFTMTLDPTGAYTFTLHAPVDQPIAGEDSIAINLNGRVTVTDSGGPGADTNVPLNASITVIDDTPLIGTPTAALAGELTLDESAVGTDSDGGVLPVGVASVTANFADNFAAASPSYGADGAGSTGTAVLPNVGPTWHVAGAADFNGDGKADILWQNGNGQAAIWTMDGMNPTAGGAVGPNPGPSWHVKDAADFNGDGKADILWQNDSGQAAIWAMDGMNLTGGTTVGPNPGTSWHVKDAADFNGDGKADILWQNDSGQAAIWTMDGMNLTGGGTVGPNPGPSWHVKDAADFNGDGKADILWQNDSGQAAIWTMDGMNLTGGTTVGPNPGPSWHVEDAADFNGDGKADILWQNDSGQAAIWAMDGMNLTGGATVGPNPGPSWHIEDAADLNSDGKADILWQSDSGLPSIWTMDGTTVASTGSTSLAFVLSSEGLGSGLYALDNTDTTTGDTDGIGQGDEILLYVSADGTTVTGSRAATESGITAANTYFTIEVDNDPLSPTFGQVTFAQTQNIWHDDTSDSDDPEALTTAAAGDLTLTQTVTDADGDTASASINLGAGVFTIQDDGPDAVVIGTPAAIVLDESPVAGDGIVSATADFSVNFSATNFGTDGASSARYALVLPGAGVASGLFALDAADTTAGDGDGIGQGASIVLNKVGNDILGQIGGVTYFTISVNGNGVVTFTDNTANNLWHSNTGNPDDPQTLTLSDPALLQLTVMDADGDTASAALNLGAGVFTIQDDGPVQNTVIATADTLVLDETRPVTTDTPLGALPAGLATVTANYANNFSVPAFGTDGAGSASYALVLTGAGVASGLFALGVNGAQGAPIVLNQAAPGADIIGTAGGTEYFRISIDPVTGVVTFSQGLNIWHDDVNNPDDPETLTLSDPALLQLTQTVTDADGDSVNASINLGAGVFAIQDDGPSVEIAPAVADATPTTDTVAEDGPNLSGAITVVEGADQNATLAVTLGGGAVLSQPLNFTMNGAPQNTSATVTLGGDELGVLTIDITAGGAVTWTFNPSPDSSGNPSFSFTATVTDADGDVDADTHTISITEGAPPTSTGTLALIVDEKDLADGTTAGGNAGGEAGNPDTVDVETGGLVFTAGSDAIASIKFDLAAGQPTIGTGLDNLAAITWALSVDGLTLTGSIGGTAVIELVLSGQLTAGVGGTAAPTVTATLLSEFPHENLADADTLTITGIKVVALDSDGTGLAAPATISVQVLDDEPSVEIAPAVADATPTTDTVAEDGPNLSGAITVVEGADQNATLAVTLGGGAVLSQPLNFTMNGAPQNTSATVTLGGDELGVLTIDITAGGAVTWTFNPSPDSSGNPSFSFTATVTDADGDVDADTHTISITEGAPPTSTGTLALIVDEKDLADGTTAGGNAGGEAGNPDTVDVETGGLVFTAGSDAIASIKFDLAAGQPTIGTGLDNLAAITWALSVDGLTLTGSIGGTAVIELVLSGQLTAGVGGTAAPTVTATLLSEFPHENLADADTLTITGIKVVALDSDGTGLAAPATISVQVLDDEPSVEIAPAVADATPTTDTVAEDGPNLSGAITVVEGADQNATLAVTLGGGAVLSQPLNFTMNGAPQNTSATVTLGGDELGVLTIDITAGGAVTWTFNPSPDSSGNPSFSFTATVTDADGDVDADTHTISITEGAPPTSTGTLALIVDEKDLADGTTAGGNAGGEAGNPDTVDVETGGLVFTAGSDAIASIKFDLAAGQPTIGTGLDNLAAITWALSVDGLTLTGSIGGTAVIELVLSGQLTAGVGGTAAPTVTATLLSEFPHENLADADTLTITGIKVVALDSDGTGLAAPATISVQVLDDEPSVEIAPAVADATPTTDTVAEDGPNLSGAITVVEGADQNATLAVTLGGGAVLSQPLNFTMNGAPQNTSATVTLGGDELGVLTIDITAGGAVTWTFNPSPDSSGNPSFSFTATVTDADGDVDADTHTISITEGAPPTSTGTLALIVDEKDLADGTTAGGNAGGEAGNPDTVDVETGGLVFTAGSDAIASIKFDLAAGQPTIGTGLDNLAAITWALSVDGLTLTGSIGGTAVIELVLSGQLTAGVGGTAAPTVTATLLSEFPHENLADADTLTITGIKVVALDSDGTGLAAPATISVQVLDDEPSVEIAPAVADATPTTDTVAEDGPNLSGAITVVEGADQNATLAVTLGGGAVLSQPLNFTMNGAPQNTSATVTLGGDELGVLTIDITAGGAVTWTFNPSPDSSGNPSFSFTATVTDADGDVDADTHTISITEGAPPTSTGTLALIVDEKDLADGTTAGGNAGGEAGNPDTVDVETGGLVFTAGSDAIASIKFDLAAGQPTIGTGLDNLAAITWALSVDGLTLTGSIGGTAVIELVLSGQLTAGVGGTAAPTVTATLLSEFPHENLADADTLTITGIKVVALDSDGTGLAAPATISVQVLDDEPVQVAGAVAQTVYEDLLAGGNPDTPANPVDAATVATGTLAGLVSFGADQPGTITLSTNTAGLPQNLTSIGAPVVYNVTGNLLTAFVDSNGTPGFQAGAGGDRQVFTLQITDPATGAYAFTLLDQLDHGLLTNDNDDALLPINLSSVIVATDADGDSVPLSGGFIISVENDIPVATAATVAQTVYEDLLAGGNPDTPANPAGASTVATGTLAGLVSFGADQPGTITLSPTTSGLPQNLTSIGAPVVYNVTGNLLTAFVDSNGTPGFQTGAGGDRQVFTLQITDPATGAYTFTLLDQLDHGLGTNDNDEALLAINLSSVIVATDADGDFIPLSGGFIISVENDIPVATAATVAQTVYEDLLAGGNPDTPANPAGASTVATGTLAGLVSFGADQPGTITLSPTTSGLPQNLTSIGAPVVYNVTGNLLTAFVDSNGTPGFQTGAGGDRQVFTLQITPATGAYTFTLLDQLDHGLGTNDNDEALLAINLSSVIVATDADGDFIPLSGGFTMSVENDIPVATAATVAQTVYEDLLPGGNPDTPANPAGSAAAAAGTLAALVSFGADQPGTITLSPTTSGLPQNLTSIGAPVVYNVTGNLLTAFVDSNGTPGFQAGAGGDRQVFTLQITNTTTGAYTFTLLDQLDHGLGTNDSDEALLAINLSSVIVATDADGDFTPLSGGFIISVENDIPVIFSIENKVVANTPGSVTGVIDLVYGADEGNQSSPSLATVTTDAGNRTTNSGLVITGWDDLPNIVETLSADGKTLTATGDAGVFYTLVLNDTTNTYTLTHTERPIVNIPVEFPPATGGPGVEILTATGGAYEIAFNGGIFNGTILEDLGPANQNDDVKSTGNGFGIGGSTGQTTFVDNEGFTASFSSGGSPVDVDSITFGLGRFGGNPGANVTVNWIAYDNGVAVVGGSGNQVLPLPVNNAIFLININPPGQFDEIDVWITGIDGANNVRLENFLIGTSVIPEDQPLHFDIVAVDGDGDVSATSGFDVLLQGGAGPLASLDIAANLLTEPNASSLVTIHFSEAVTGFGFNDLTPTGGALDPLSFQQIDADTYGVSFTASPNSEGTGRVTLTGVYADLALNPGITGATDTVDVNTLNSTLDATILTTGTSGLGQTVALTFVDLQNPIFSYAGLYDLGAQGGAFQRDAGFDINASKEYAVSLEATGEIPVPIRVLTVEGVTIHVVEGTVTLQLDNDNSTLLTQTALTSIIQPNDATVHQTETASVDGNVANSGLIDPTVTPGSGAGSAENTVNYIYGADGSDDLSGANDTDVLNGGAGNDTLLGGIGNDILIYESADQKIDGADGTDVLRTDEAALGLLNNVGVTTDAATGFSVVEVVPFKQNIKNIEVLLITDDAQSNPTAGGLLNLNAQDVLNITDPNDHTLTILGNKGDVLNLGIGVSAWNDNGKALDANGFQTFTQAFEGINLILKVEHDVVVVGQDSMNGGAGADTHVATNINESGNTDLTADVISGWDSTDVIDLSGIDAISSIDANEHASVPESIPNYELPQAALDHMNEFFPPQHPEQPAEHHSPSATGFDHMTDAAREQLQVHHPDWFVI